MSFKFEDPRTKTYKQGEIESRRALKDKKLIVCGKIEPTPRLF